MLINELNKLEKVILQKDVPGKNQFLWCSRTVFFLFHLFQKKLLKNRGHLKVSRCNQYIFQQFNHQITERTFKYTVLSFHKTIMVILVRKVMKGFETCPNGHILTTLPLK